MLALRDVYVRGPRTIIGGREQIAAILSRAPSLELSIACCLVRYAPGGRCNTRAMVSWFLMKHVADPMRQLIKELGYECLQEEGLTRS